MRKFQVNATKAGIRISFDTPDGETVLDTLTIDEAADLGDQLRGNVFDAREAEEKKKERAKNQETEIERMEKTLAEMKAKQK